jgi:hypothetical protein
VNDAGQVAGFGYNGTNYQAYIGTTSGSAAISLPAGGVQSTVSSQSLNNLGVVVGTSDGGWIWDAADGTVLLSSLVPAGWYVEDAMSISNNGLILAYASFNGGPYEYVELAAVPVTGDFWSRGCGLLLAIFARRTALRGLSFPNRKPITFSTRALAAGMCIATSPGVAERWF